MDGELPFGVTHTRKRSHAQMTLQGSSSPTWSGVFDHVATPREPTPSSSRTHTAVPHPSLSNMPAQLRRYPGDGLDYRRPVSSDAVIDLTHDDEGAPAPPNDVQHGRPRPPRFGRDILQEGVIDLSDDEPRNETQVPTPESPEFEIISARRIDPPRPSVHEDDVEFVRENPLPETLRRHHANNNVTMMHQLLADMHNTHPTLHLEQQMHRRAERQRHATIARIHHRIRDGGRTYTVPRVGRRAPQQGFLRPTFDYRATGFDLGLDFDDLHDEPVPPPAPTYEAPAKAAQGYTRSPQEEDSLVCPNCGHELCNGETEQKRQVWIAKHCGHVYCGECTANRSIKKSAKGKERQATGRTKPFKECVVEGCQKRVSSKSHMFQVFL